MNQRPLNGSNRSLNTSSEDRLTKGADMERENTEILESAVWLD